MGQNYRYQSGRSDRGSGGRYRSDRYQTGGEQRYQPQWDERDQGQRGFEGDRSYQAGGYSGEFGYGRSNQRDDQGRDWRGSSGTGQLGGRDYSYGRQDQGQRFDEGNRWSEGPQRRDFEELYGRDEGTSTSRWNEDAGDRGGYFGTGSYIDDGGASRGFGADFERARRQVQQRYGSSSREPSYYNSGDANSYGRGYYGAQSGYGRDQERSQSPWRTQQGGQQFGGQQFGGQQRSNWSSGQEFSGRGGSGMSSGAYGYDSGGRGDSTSYSGSQWQSHKGRGPQGYQRSDDRLKEMICERLTDDPAIDASNVSVEVTNQIVKLTGTVEDRSTKYEIEELIDSLGGVKDIDNQLRTASWQQPNAQSSQDKRSEWDSGSSALASGRQSTTGTTTTSGSTSSSTSGSSKRN